METLGYAFVLITVGGVVLAVAAALVVSLLVVRWRRRTLAEMERTDRAGDAGR